MLNNYPDVLTVKQLAEVLNIGLNAAYELVNRHEIGAKRIGRAIRIPKSGVIMYLNSARYVVGQNDNSRLCQSDEQTAKGTSENERTAAGRAAIQSVTIQKLARPSSKMSSVRRKRGQRKGRIDL